MLHLLPQYQKDKVIKEYHLRLAVVVICSILFLSLVYAVFMLPSYMLLRNQISILEAQKKSLSSIVNVSGLAQNNNADTWKIVDALTPFKKTLVPSEAIDMVNPKVKGVHIAGYNFVQINPGEPIIVTITGTADNREGLSTYVKDLNTAFSGVKLPLSTLAKQSNITFDFKFQIDNKTNE